MTNNYLIIEIFLQGAKCEYEKNNTHFFLQKLKGYGREKGMGVRAKAREREISCIKYHILMHSLVLAII